VVGSFPRAAGSSSAAFAGISGFHLPRRRVVKKSPLRYILFDQKQAGTYLSDFEMAENVHAEAKPAAESQESAASAPGAARQDSSSKVSKFFFEELKDDNILEGTKAWLFVDGYAWDIVFAAIIIILNSALALGKYKPIDR
jgi:hypothetical protein